MLGGVHVLFGGVERLGLAVLVSPPPHAMATNNTINYMACPLTHELRTLTSWAAVPARNLPGATSVVQPVACRTPVVQVLEYSDEETHKMLDDAGGPVNVFLIWTTDASTFDELATQVCK